MFARDVLFYECHSNVHFSNRVELLSASKSSRMDYLGTLEGENFCMQLISEMAKAFLRVDDSVQVFLLKF